MALGNELEAWGNLGFSLMRPKTVTSPYNAESGRTYGTQTRRNRRAWHQIPGGFMNDVKTCGGYRTTISNHDDRRGYTRCSCGKVVKLRYTLERKEDVYIPRHKPSEKK